MVEVLAVLRSYGILWLNFSPFLCAAGCYDLRIYPGPGVCGLRLFRCGDHPGCHAPDAGRSTRVGAAGLLVVKWMARN